MKRFCGWFILLIASVVVPGTQGATGQSVIAGRSVPVDSGHLTATLLSELSGVRPGTRVELALKLEILPGWHTYWRNPGDSGAPLELTWELPPDFRAGGIQWPYPERIPYGPLMNFGYHDEVVFPLSIDVPESLDSDEVTIGLKGRWLVCADICIPEDGELVLTLPVTKEAAKPVPENMDVFRQARERIPHDTGLESWYSARNGEIELFVAMSGLQASRIRSVAFFPWEEGVLDFPAPQTFRVDTGGLSLRLKAGYLFVPGESSMEGVVVVTEDAGERLETAFVIHPKVPSVPDGEEQMNLWLALLFAFIGGLILNLMPCVFPVLSIKFLALAEATRSEPKVIRRHGIVYTTGVVLSFLLVAGILVSLRAAGEEIGWGFQLQSPVVVGLLVYLFVLIGLNLAGYYELGGGWMSLGEGLTRKGGYAGSFYTGVLAAVVAAPCTAPFMGAAIGFALGRDAVSALAIFASLGLGMATPFQALCWSPALLKRLPRPGPWMETLREFFAFLMYATAIWLIWVLNQQTGPDGLLAVMSGLLLIGFALWLLRRGVTGLPGRATVLLAVVFAVLLTGLVKPAGPAPETGNGSRAEEPAGMEGLPYSREALEKYVEQGPVFVNFTAAWCITCKVNDLAALSSPKVEAVFRKYGVTYLVADWTNEDPKITRALQEYGRSGVPLYLLYEKGADRARILPQILTESALIEAVEAVSRASP